MIHDFLLCLETGFLSYERIITRSYGPLPKCFAFTCSPKQIENGTEQHTCSCGFTYNLTKIRFTTQCDGKTTIDFRYMQNVSEIYLDEFTWTFDVWTGSRTA